MSTFAKTRVVLVRHGQTEWNDGARFQGHMDSALTRAGVLQAESLGRRLAGEKIAALYSSDLGRARHTAELIAAGTKLSIVQDARLRERGLGVFAGLTRADIAVQYPEETRRYFSRDPEYAMPKGESLLGRFKLGLECLDEIAGKHRGSTVVAVTHGGMVHGMFRHVTGVPFDAPRRFAIRNAAYNVFLHDEGGWSLETWGDISHYPAEIMESAAFHIEKHTPEVQ